LRSQPVTVVSAQVHLDARSALATSAQAILYLDFDLFSAARHASEFVRPVCICRSTCRSQGLGVWRLARCPNKGRSAVMSRRPRISWCVTRAPGKEEARLKQRVVHLRSAFGSFAEGLWSKQHFGRGSSYLSRAVLPSADGAGLQLSRTAANARPVYWPRGGKIGHVIGSNRDEGFKCGRSFTWMTCK
jgi:hypothetical protein